jgi:hypothetical protein
MSKPLEKLPGCGRIAFKTILPKQVVRMDGWMDGWMELAQAHFH